MKPTIGIALGSGGAKGWAHIGVLRAFEELGIRPTHFSGASMGAVVAAYSANHHLDALEDFALRLTRGKVWQFLDFRLPRHGFLKGRLIERFLKDHLDVETFEELHTPLTVVATDYHSGEEVHFSEGPILPALRGSIAVPVTMDPYEYQGRILLDGGVVNPVPVNVLHMQKVDMTIAVDVNSFPFQVQEERGEEPHYEKNKRRLPKFFNVMENTTLLLMKKITDQHFQESHPDVIIRPKLGKYWYNDFHRAAEIIEAGYQATVDVFSKLSAEQWDLLGVRKHQLLKSHTAHLRSSAFRDERSLIKE